MSTRRTRRPPEGDDRHIPIDFARISRTRKILGAIAVGSFILAALVPPLQPLFILIGLFSGLGIGWVE